MFFDDLSSLLRTALSGVFAYAALILFLRVSGKRTLSKMNAFDFVVTVALGSTLSAVITSSDLPLANGLLALALLIVLQFAAAWLAVRSAGFRRLIKSQPALLFHRGEFLGDALRRERVTYEEIYAAARQAGVADLREVDAIVLETDASFSVLRRTGAAPERPTLARVRGAG